MAPNESVYEEYNRRHAPKKDPWIGYGPRAAEAADKRLKGTLEKSDIGAADAKPEDNDPLRHP